MMTAMMILAIFPNGAGTRLVAYHSSPNIKHIISTVIRREINIGYLLTLKKPLYLLGLALSAISTMAPSRNCKP